MVDWGRAECDKVEAVVRKLWGYLSMEVPAIHVEPPEQVPGSYHKLLVHNAGMTATLEAHWGQRLAVDLIADDLIVDERSLYRFVGLYTGEDGERQVVELAAIRIVLDAFPALLRPEFFEGVRPFGGILARAGITFRARQSGFFRLEADEFIARKASIALGATLYGRVNELRGEDELLLCETVEMLPRAGTPENTCQAEKTVPDTGFGSPY